MEGKYTVYKFHFLNGITEIIQLFDDILIYWPAPVYTRKAAAFGRGLSSRRPGILGNGEIREWMPHPVMQTLSVMRGPYLTLFCLSLFLLPYIEIYVFVFITFMPIYGDICIFLSVSLLRPWQSRVRLILCFCISSGQLYMFFPFFFSFLFFLHIKQEYAACGLGQHC